MNAALAVTLTVDQLDALIEKAVDRAIAKRGLPGDDPWLTRAEAAVVLGCVPDVVSKRVKYHGLIGHKNGRDWRFRKSELDAWLSARRVKGAVGQ